MAATPIQALEALAESLGADASVDELERALPIVTRMLKNAISRDRLPDLGETEPAFGLRFDSSELSSELSTGE